MIYKGKSLHGQKVEPLQYREVERNGVVGQEWHRPKPQACLADAVDMDADEMARALHTDPGACAERTQASPRVPSRRGLDVLREIRAVAEQAMAITSLGGTLEPHVAQVTAEQIRLLAVELAG